MRTRLAAVVFFLLPITLGASDDRLDDELATAEAVPWTVLRDMTYTDDGRTYHATFSPQVKKLNGREIMLAGYMIPVEAVEKHSRFVFTGLPLAGCSFCGGGEETQAYVDVRVVDPIRFSYDPIVIRGTLTLVTKDEMGMFYRLKDAQSATLPAEDIQKLLPPVPQGAYQVPVEEGAP